MHRQLSDVGPTFRKVTLGFCCASCMSLGCSRRQAEHQSLRKSTTTGPPASTAALSCSGASMLITFGELSSCHQATVLARLASKWVQARLRAHQQLSQQLTLKLTGMYTGQPESSPLFPLAPATLCVWVAAEGRAALRLPLSCVRC